MIHALYYAFCRFLFTLYCRLEVRGREHLPKPPYILCSNHCSHLDTPVLMLSANLPFHRFGMVAAKDYFFGGKKKRKLLSRLMNLLPIDRQPKRKQIEEHLLLCEQFCRKSQGVLIFFPEGTRSRSGRMQPFKKGAVQYAAQLNIPIIPVHIDGTFRSFPKGKKLIRPGKIEVHIGKPMHVKDSGLAGLRTATAELEEAVLALKERPNE